MRWALRAESQHSMKSSNRNIKSGQMFHNAHVKVRGGRSCPTLVHRARYFFSRRAPGTGENQALPRSIARDLAIDASSPDRSSEQCACKGKKGSFFALPRFSTSSMICEVTAQVSHEQLCSLVVYTCGVTARPGYDELHRSTDICQRRVLTP